jgi:integrase
MTSRGWSDGILRVKLDDGRVRFRLRMWVGGELKKATFPSRESAEAARDFLLSKRRAESLGIPGPNWPKAEPTIASVFDAFDLRIVRLGLSDTYRKQVQGVKKLFVSFRGPSAPAIFTRQDLEEFVGWCRSPGNTKSRGRQIKNAIAIFRMVLRDAELPIPKAPTVNVPRRAPKTITKKQLEAYLEALGWGTVQRAFAELDLRTALRESEARALTIGDVDLEAGVMHVHHGKGKPGERGSEELHPIPAGAIAALRAYRAKEPKNLPPSAPFLAIRSDRKGSALRRHTLTKDSLQKRLRKASRDAGIPERGGVGWLRHQAATLARASGADLKSAAGALGHVDEKMVAATYDESARAAEERWAHRLALGARIDELLPVDAGRGRA